MENEKEGKKKIYFGAELGLFSRPPQHRPSTYYILCVCVCDFQQKRRVE